jgi:hypothetical protein
MTTLTQVGGACLLLFGGPLLGALPLHRWMGSRMGSRMGNRPVPARQTLGQLLDLGLGIGVALLAQYFFAPQLEWSIVGLIALVCGRYWTGGGAATLAVLGGYGVTDPIGALFVAGFSLIGLTVLRHPSQAKLAFWILLPLITLLRHPTENPLIVMTLLLSGLLFWIDGQPLSAPASTDRAPIAPTAAETFRFFRADGGLASLDDDLAARKFGTKAATLADLRRRGYPVPIGWVLLPGDDPEPLAQQLQPTRQSPMLLRASSIGSTQPAITITRPDALWSAIITGFEAGPAALILQPYIWGVFSGRATPGTGSAAGTVQVWALAGEAKALQDWAAADEYQVTALPQAVIGTDWQLSALPEGLTVIGQGEAPEKLIAQVAWLTHHMAQSTGQSRTMIWSHDGEQLWILGY